MTRQRRGGRLREEKRRLEIAPQQFIPLRDRYFAQWRWIKSRGVIDHRVQSPPALQYMLNQIRQFGRVVETGPQQLHRAGPPCIQFGRQRFRRRLRAVKVQGNSIARLVQNPDNLRANPSRSPRDQRDLGIFIHGGFSPRQRIHERNIQTAQTIGLPHWEPPDRNRAKPFSDDRKDPVPALEPGSGTPRPPSTDG